MLSRIVELLLVGSMTVHATLETPDDLHNQYYTIFPSGNRNAASHRWATYVLERSEEMTDAVLRNMFASFCAVSGSPVYPSAGKRWKMTLPQVTGGPNVTGMMYFCCSPCVCDTYDFIKIDTKTITTKDGPRQYYFTVIGNPCLHPDELTKTWTDTFSGQTTSLAYTAPDVKCSSSDLEKATMSDNGHIILSMFFEMDTANHATSGEGFQDSSQLEGYCKKRAETGYASGMGEIFRKVALISPVATSIYGSSASSNSDMTESSTSTTLPQTTTSTTSIAASNDPSTSLASSTSSTSADTSSTASSSISSSSGVDEVTASPSTTTGSTMAGTSKQFRETTGSSPTVDSQGNGLTSAGKQTAGAPTILSCIFIVIFLKQSI